MINLIKILLVWQFQDTIYENSVKFRYIRKFSESSVHFHNFKTRLLKSMADILQ